MYYIVIENLSLLATVVLLVDAKLGKKAVVVVCPMFFCCPTDVLPTNADIILSSDFYTLYIRQWRNCLLLILYKGKQCYVYSLLVLHRVLSSKEGCGRLAQRKRMFSVLSGKETETEKCR